MAEVKLSEAQVALARHALGLDGQRRRSYRNRYVVDAGCPDHDHWMAMVAAGLARVRKSISWMGGMDIFWLTREGGEAVLQKGESLCSEDFPLAVRRALQEARHG